MFHLIISFVLLALSTYLGIVMSKTDSYLLISYNHWVIESSLWVALAAIVLLFIVTYMLLRLIGKSTRISKNFRRWKKSHRQTKAHVLTQQGLCHLAEGHWHKAEQQLIKAAKIAKKPLIEYLGAATAANLQHAFERRDRYLRLAHANDKHAAIAIELTQAQLQIAGKQWEQALSTLQHLRQLSPHHRHVLKLLLQVNLTLQQWETCHQLLTPIKKHQALTKKEYTHCEYDIYLARLTEIATREPQNLKLFWKSLPRYLQDEAFTTLYIKGLLQHQQIDTALQIATGFLKHQLSHSILCLFSEITMNNAKQLTTAELWLKKHPHDHQLLLCLGQLCIREKLWGKAKDYLLNSIQQHPSSKAYYELATVYHQLGETDKAEQHYRNAAISNVQVP